jgi:predicted kinase
MAKLTIIRGLQASGKDTLARQLVADTLSEPAPAMIVNRDYLRFMAGLDTKPGPYESTITLQQHALVRAGLKAGRHVISSDTNLNSKYVKELGKIGEFFGAEIDVIDMDIPLEECIRRDMERAKNGGHMVGEDVIRATYKRYFINGKFPRNPLSNNVQVKLEPYVRDESLPTAYIFDIDGTKAGIGEKDGLPHRSPYDYTKVIDDFAHEDVIGLERTLREAGHVVINLSGREDSCWNDTMRWLQSYGQYRDMDQPRLFMRKTGDKRADFIIKYEIFRDKIAPYYNVLGVFDDRDQVVKMWRDIGVRCYQVNYGNF